jgi:hypothetical protein
MKVEPISGRRKRSNADKFVSVEERVLVSVWALQLFWGLALASM